MAKKQQETQRKKPIEAPKSKKINFVMITIAVILGVIIVFAAAALFPNSDIVESYTTGEANQINIAPTACQTFTIGNTGIAKDYNLTGFSSKIGCSSCDATWSLRSINSSGLPDTILSQNVSPPGMPGDAWYNVSMPPYIMENNTQYAMCIEETGGSFFFKFDDGDGTYTGGNIIVFNSTDGGVHNQTGDDDLFIVYGENPISPIVTLNVPINNSLQLDNEDVIINCSSNHNDPILNLTLFINDVQNITVTNTTADQTLLTLQNTLQFDADKLINWSCQSVDDSSDIGTSGVNFFDVSRIRETNQTFNNVTTEGATETFSINFTKASELQVSTVNLVYNGTFNSFPYSVDGDEIFSQGSVVIPAIASDVNVSFHWNVSFDDGGTANSTSYNQSISTINIDNCTSFSVLIYNFTQFDEEDRLALGVSNNTMEVEVNIYDLSKTSLLINFSQTFINTNPAQVCLEDSILETVNYSSYVTVKYFANTTDTNQTYSIEYHNILNQTLGNKTAPFNIPLYNLKEKDTTKFRLTFRDGSYTLAPNILVNVFRKYVGDNIFRLVEIPLTDSNGQTMLNLVRNDIIYNFIMTDEAGNIIATFNSVTAFCQDFTIGECTINLAADSIAEETYDYNAEFEISITPPTYDNDTKVVSISFLTDDLTPKKVDMEVFRNNQFGNRSVCTDTLTAASGVLSCNVSSITDTDQFLFVHVIVEGSLAQIYTINLNATTLNFGRANGAFYAFLLILFIITLFIEDKKILVVALGLGWIACLALGLLNGTIVGSASSGIWILVTIAIYLWKLNKEDSI